MERLSKPMLKDRCEPDEYFLRNAVLLSGREKGGRERKGIGTNLTW
jgi:hypothetical protein